MFRNSLQTTCPYKRYGPNDIIPPKLSSNGIAAILVVKWPITMAPHRTNIHMGEDNGSAFMTPSLTHSPVLAHFDTANSAESSGHKSSSKLQCGDSFQVEISPERVNHVQKKKGGKNNPKSLQAAEIFWH